MKTITFHISPLHATTVATHLLLVLQNSVHGRSAANLSENILTILGDLDQVYQKLQALSLKQDDETPLSVTLSLSEAEAFIKAFTEEPFQSAGQGDAFYDQRSYAAYFAQIYSGYLERISEAYVEARAA